MNQFYIKQRLRRRRFNNMGGLQTDWVFCVSHHDKLATYEVLLRFARLFKSESTAAANPLGLMVKIALVHRWNLSYYLNTRKSTSCCTTQCGRWYARDFISKLKTSCTEIHIHTYARD